MGCMVGSENVFKLKGPSFITSSAGAVLFRHAITVSQLKDEQKKQNAY